MTVAVIVPLELILVLGINWVRIDILQHVEFQLVHLSMKRKLMIQAERFVRNA